MPYKSEYTNLKIPKEKDNRIKLTDEDRIKIKELYGKVSQRKLAKMFGVSRTLIIFIGRPEKLEKEKLRHKLAKYTYSNEYNNAQKRKTRQYRQELYLRGELIK